MASATRRSDGEGTNLVGEEEGMNLTMTGVVSEKRFVVFGANLTSQSAHASCQSPYSKPLSTFSSLVVFS